MSVRKTVRRITRDEAVRLVDGCTEKPYGTNPVSHLSEMRQLFRAQLPLDAFVDNESGDRYDGTVDEARARAYAARSADAVPPVIAGARFATGKLRILDGGHRLSAARLRGDAAIDTIFTAPPHHELCADVEDEEEPEAPSS